MAALGLVWGEERLLKKKGGIRYLESDWFDEGMPQAPSRVGKE